MTVWQNDRIDSDESLLKRREDDSSIMSSHGEEVAGIDHV